MRIEKDTQGTPIFLFTQPRQHCVCLRSLPETAVHVWNDCSLCIFLAYKILVRYDMNGSVLNLYFV